MSRVRYSVFKGGFVVAQHWKGGTGGTATPYTVDFAYNMGPTA